MDDLKDKSLFDLACELNVLMVKINELQIRYNKVIDEIITRKQELKDDPNLQHIETRKEEDFERDRTHKL